MASVFASLSATAKATALPAWMPTASATSGPAAFWLRLVPIVSRTSPVPASSGALTVRLVPVRRFTSPSPLSIPFSAGIGSTVAAAVTPIDQIVDVAEFGQACRS